MYNQPFIIPRYISQSTIAQNTGILKKLLTSIKKLNWSNVINNTSKTLGIINQTIPIAKQIGPILSNAKSMIKIASIFKDETDINPNKNKKITSHPKNFHEKKDFTNYDENPTFFLN